MTEKINKHVVLVKRPGLNAEPEEHHFGCENCLYPDNIEKNEILIKTCYLSVDPALRCMMNENPGVEYLKPWQLGQRIIGASGVGIVMESKHPEYKRGDIIAGTMGWPWVNFFTHEVEKQDPSIFMLQKFDPSVYGSHPSVALSFLVGLTALIGLWEKGHVSEGANQTLVVSGAAGATGSIAGQIGRLLGCSNIVGICGTTEKCDWLTTDLGFTSAINYKTDDISQCLKKTCPNGIDIYFDNVGGDISEIVIKQMKTNSHVILCGQISQYNKDVPYPPPISEETQRILSENKITRDRFLLLDYAHRYEEALKHYGSLVMSGKIKYRETVAEGLAATGKAFVSMMRGGNIGKQIIHVADPDL